MNNHLHNSTLQLIRMDLINQEKIDKNILNHTFKIFENGIQTGTILGRKLSKKRQDFIRECIEQASKGCLTHRHGAVVVRDNKIASVGYNYDFGNKIKHGKYSIHAEVDAILKSPPIIYDSVLYVVRVKTMDGKIVGVHNSNPCDNCISFCNDNKSVVIYSS